MNDTPTNKGGYLKSEGRRHVLEDILPLFPDELAEAFEPRFMSEEIDGERHEYADTLWVAPFALFGHLQPFRACVHLRHSQLLQRVLFARLRARL